MKFAISWAHPAIVTFYALSIHEATAIDRAVIRFAETGEGELEWDPPHHRLRTGTHDALLALDRHARRLAVLRIYRVR